MTRKCPGCGKAGHRLESRTSRAALEDQAQARFQRTILEGSEERKGTPTRSLGTLTREDTHSVA